MFQSSSHPALSARARQRLAVLACRTAGPPLLARVILAAGAIAIGLTVAGVALAVDNDGDGFDPPDDCDDSDASIHPDAPEVCGDGVDNDCNGSVDLFPFDADMSGAVVAGELALGVGDTCIFFQDGPADECTTGGDAACNGSNTGLVCANLNGEAAKIFYAPEVLSTPSCADAIDNDCDGDPDLADTDCQLASDSICDGLDNDFDGQIDEDFNVGAPCSVGFGVCERIGIIGCDSEIAASCQGTPGSAGAEDPLSGNSCADNEDNDCDGLVDENDPDCAAFGLAELCNGIDDNGDNVVDEGFAAVGLQCSEGVGACAQLGTIECSQDLTSTECNATASAPTEPVEVSCTDFVDNDCNGLTDADDPACAGAFADLGAFCSLPYSHGRSGADCNGKHVVEFGARVGADVHAELLALDADGNVLAVLEGIQPGDQAHLKSRVGPEDWRWVTKRNKKGSRHTVSAPTPLLRVTATAGGVSDVAYCSILPYLEVTAPDGLSISLSEGSSVDVAAHLPLADVDSLRIQLNGNDLFDPIDGIGVDPATDFPTGETPLCTVPGACMLTIQAGCGDGTDVAVEVKNLLVEGLDGGGAASARSGVEVAGQVNTMSFTLEGLPPGSHIVHVSAEPLPLPSHLSRECVVDDLADAGIVSAFGFKIVSPLDQAIVSSAPVTVEGSVCGAYEIAALSINGHEVMGLPDEAGQCTPGDGISSADECVVDFAEEIGATDLAQAISGTSPTGTFHPGSNRLLADASDVLSNRTVHTDNVFALTGVPLSPSAAVAQEVGLALKSTVRPAFFETLNATIDTIDPAFVVALEEEGIQDFFNEKCVKAIDEFTSRARANLENKSFGSFDVRPGCSCDLNNVQLVLEDLDFTPSTADPTCKVTLSGSGAFSGDGEIGVKINLPDMRIQVGAHASCEDEGLFGECIARTTINVTAVTQIKDISFAFAITEDNIENKTEPPEAAQVFVSTVFDNGGRPLFLDPPNNLVKNPAYQATTQSNASVSCWGASLCQVGQLLAAGFIEVFTLGFADGLKIVDFLDFEDHGFKESFFAELSNAEPDTMALEEVEVDENTVAAAGHAQFVPGPIDVEIESGGLTVAFPADFSDQSVDPDDQQTPLPFNATPASAPSVAQAVAAGSEISLLVADDVFNRMFASMKASGGLKAFCTDADNLTVDDILPAETDGGCDSLGDPSLASGAILQGICHAIRAADCSTLTAATDFLELTKIGTCTGFRAEDCTQLPFVAKIACNATPNFEIMSSDSLLLCASQDIEPQLLFEDEDASDGTITTHLVLNDTNVVFALDRTNDGYLGKLGDLPGCFGPDGNAAPDCLLYAACLDLSIEALMGIDNLAAECAANETGFVFEVLTVSGSTPELGVVCSAATSVNDTDVTRAGFDSFVIDTLTNNAQDLTPPFCVEGLSLNDVLDFSSEDARMFGISTDGGTGFADFLGITGNLSGGD